MTRRIDYISQRLDEWAERKARELDGGRARVPLSSIYSRRERVACAANPGDFTLGDPQGQEMDELVVRLSSVDPNLYWAVVQVHLHGRRWSVPVNARKLHISATCLRDRLARADLFLDTWLREKRPPPARMNLESIRLAP